MLNIVTGKQKKPLKTVIYGPEGIGKSTLAAAFPNPLFIDTEGSTARMDVARIEKPESFSALVATVEEVANTPGVCDTLVLDTADWAEQMCIEAVCAKYKKTGVEEFGFGKGYTYVSEEFFKLIVALDKVIASGKNVVVTAHAKMRKFEQPDEMGAYDRWEMKLSKQVAPLLKEWCDLLLFCNYKTIVVTTENKTHKAQGGRRVMYTTHTPCWDAKNRFGLPEELPLEYKAIEGIVLRKKEKQAPASAEPSEEQKNPDNPYNLPPETKETNKILVDITNRIQEENVDFNAILAVAQLRGKRPEGVNDITHCIKTPELTRWIWRNFETIKRYIADRAEEVGQAVKTIVEEKEQEKKRKVG